MLTGEGISVRYRNGAFGVLNSSVKVEPNAVVAMLGANGAGKTTTVRALTGFLRTEGARIVSGTVTLDGVPMTNKEAHTFAHRGVAFIPERRKIFANLTVRENLETHDPRSSRAKRTEALDRVTALFPMLAERRNEQAGRLSGGQQQMLAIGRALMRDPKYLVIDEMTLGLHASLRPMLFEKAAEIAATGTGVLLVDESVNFALEVAKYVYVMNNGELVSEGPPEVYRDSDLLTAGYLGLADG